jgi:ribose transport system substrate-binding protein
MKRTSLLVTAGTVGVLLAACTTGATDPAGAPGGSPRTDPGGSVIDVEVTGTVGPKGETPTRVSELTLTADEVARLRAGNFTAALLWHEASAWVNTVTNGVKAEFDRLGIDIVATADAKFDAGTQANQLQTALVSKPDVILSQAVDPSTGAAAFQPAVAAGVDLVFADQAPDGFAHGQHYASVISGDLYERGRQAALALGRAMGGRGEVGVLFYDAKFHVTNQRDAAFKTTLAEEFPDIEIVAQQGFTDPNTAESAASAMLTQNPGLGGIYTSWAQPAQGVLSALRTAGNTTTKVVTLDLDETIAVDMVSGGATVAITCDLTWDFGRGMALAAAYALLGKRAPAFGIVDAITVTKDNIAEGYRNSEHQELPKAVADAIG